MRTGDTVKHRPTGETWTVAYVDGDYMGWWGWPPGRTQVADCDMVEQCSDADHIALLLRIEQSSPAEGGPDGDMRVRMARRHLDEIAISSTDLDPTAQNLYRASRAEYEFASSRVIEAHGRLMEAEAYQRKIGKELREALRALLEPKQVFTILLCENCGKEVARGYEPCDHIVTPVSSYRAISSSMCPRCKAT